MGAFAANVMEIDGEEFMLARDLDEVDQLMKLVRSAHGYSKRDCVACNDSQHLTCPSCKKGSDCQFVVPTGCSSCATSICVPKQSSGGGGISGPRIGGIVGGIIGGLLVIGLITFCVWKYCIKPRRSEFEQSIYEYEDGTVASGSEKNTASRATRPQSTHTVHSIASTVLTRASNIIQIAYIPGVTNRASPSSPTAVVPPVPPIPMHHAQGAARAEGGIDEQHFFVPGDLRDSTYSGLSGYTDRTSLARTSYAPRSSVASTIYGKQAQVMTAAQPGMRAKPTVVSVKSGGTTSLAESTAPPVPAIDFEKFASSRPKSGASAFSVGSTFLNSANTATQARAQVVKVGGLKKIEVSPFRSDTDSATLAVSQISRPTTANTNLARDSGAITIIEDSPAVDQGPFSDPPLTPALQKPSSNPGLGAVMEDQAGEQDRVSDRTGSSQQRDTSPFGDQHATRE